MNLVEVVAKVNWMGVAKRKISFILAENDAFGDMVLDCLVLEVVRLVTIVNFICWNAEKQNQIAFVDEAFFVWEKNGRNLIVILRECFE